MRERPRPWRLGWLPLALILAVVGCSTSGPTVSASRRMGPSGSAVISRRPATPTELPTTAPTTATVPITPFEGRLLVATTRYSADSRSDLPTAYRLAWLTDSGVQPIAIPGDTSGVTDAAVSPDGQRVVAILGSTRVVEIGADGRNPRDIVNTLPTVNAIQPGAYLSVAWMNDQTILVRQTYPGGLLEVDLRGGLSLLPASGLTPAVSATAREIALGYVTTEPFYSIYVGGPQLNNLHKLTRDAVTEAAPAWSPDGQVIAYAANAGFADPKPTVAWELRTAGPDGANERTVITRQANVSYATLRWSPDGQSIAFTRFDVLGHRRQIGIVNREGGDLRLIEDATSNDIVLGWAP